MRKHRFVRFMQEKSYHIHNSFERIQPEGVDKLDGCLYHHDIRYGNQYPNSFLDIYSKEEWKEEKHPVFLYIHGGGFAWGDKADGDPTAKGAGVSQNWYFQSFVDAGYIFVSMNYAFAPDYRYPTQLNQVDEVVRFLQKNSDKYHMDMKYVVLSGSSAGGNLAGLYADMVTNAEFASRMQITPSLRREQLKAVVFNSALLDMERFNCTDMAIINFMFGKLGKAYYDCKNLKGNMLAKQSNVISFVTRDFPPSFISDANMGSFLDQNTELAEILKGLGIPYVFHYYEKSEAKLIHGFESIDNQYGRENMKMMLDFLIRIEKMNK